MEDTIGIHKKYGLTYIGGTYKGKLTLHDIKTRKRLSRDTRKENCKILTNLKWRTLFLSPIRNYNFGSTKIMGELK